jgi:rhodanese-related sulfurtransferase
MSAAFLAALVLAAAPVARPAAAPSQSADPAASFPVVDAAEVHARLVRNEGVLVDTRSAVEFEQGHIAGALHLPAERTKAEAARLPRDRRTPIVFYCRGVG